MARTRGITIDVPPSQAPFLPPPAPPSVAHYFADRSTVKRDMDAWELAQLLDMWLVANGHAQGLSVRLAVEAWQQLNGDMRRHFRAKHKVSA
jgi:hypothetical protein